MFITESGTTVQICREEIWHVWKSFDKIGHYGEAYQSLMQIKANDGTFKEAPTKLGLVGKALTRSGTPGGIFKSRRRQWSNEKLDTIGGVFTNRTH